MTYSELRDLSELKNFTLQSIAERIGMSRVGLKSAFENQSLSIAKVTEICKCLEITPNQFFGWEDEVKKQQIQNGGVGNTQQMDTYAVDVLKQQIIAKDEQIREKDAQISQLLKLLSNNH